jgi:hypothetical protein
MSEGNKNSSLGWAAAALVVFIVASLAAAGYLMNAGAKARRSPALPEPHPAPLATASAPKAAPGGPVPTPPRAPRLPAPTPEPPAPSELLPAFDGAPLDWSCTRQQRILLNERPAPESRIVLVILGTDYSIQGTLFLSESGATLPSNFLVKDDAWGQARHFGGQDILLGVVAFRGGYSEPALRRAAISSGWWQGKAKPAFQMNY